MGKGKRIKNKEKRKKKKEKSGAYKGFAGAKRRACLDGLNVWCSAKPIMSSHCTDTAKLADCALPKRTAESIRLRE